MLQNFSQTQGTVFHSSACISSSEGFFKNRSAHFCGKSPSSGACPSQIAILLSLGLKFLIKWKPTYIYGDLNFSDSQQVFANLFSWRKLEGSLIISWKFQGRTSQEIWITAIFPARSKVVSYDVLHHTTIHVLLDILCVVLYIGDWGSKMYRLEKSSGLSWQKVCDRLSLLLLLMCFTSLAR